MGGRIVLLAKKKVFVSYDYKNDQHLKDTFVGQARLQESPFSISDVSLRENYPNKEWVAEAKRAIDKCDLFIILLGQNTHSASGVRTEVAIAKGLGKERIQVRSKGNGYGRVKDGGTEMAWKWKNFSKKWGQLSR